jgi:dTDP-4-amino-4,6-dideoxygalactose transaminase
MIPVMRPWLGEEEAEAAAAAVESGWVAQGPRVREFEEAFAAAIGAPHAVAVSSHTAALQLALIVAGIGPGDEVIVPSLSLAATANAVRYVGAQPVFADADAVTQNLVPQTVEPHLTGRTRAVVLADQAGVPADLDAVRALCEPHQVTVIEDAACAAGSTYRGRPAGAGATLAAVSFDPDMLITAGKGGMLTAADGSTAARFRRLREHGMDMSAADRHRSRQPVIERYTEVGFNFRLTDIQAAVGLVQLRKLAEIVARRRALARRYQQLLSGMPGLVMAGDPPYGETNYQSFWVLLPEDSAVGRDELMQLFAGAGISVRRGAMPLHLESVCAGARPFLPVTERLAKRTLILPLFHQMTESQQEQVVSVLASALASSPQEMPVP